MKSTRPITKLAASKGTVLRFPPFCLLAYAALFAPTLGPYCAFAGEEKAIHGVPGKVRDAKLFEDGAAWLEKRLAKAECRKSLGDAFAEYRKAPSDAAFLKLAPLVEECGRCATQPVLRKTERPVGKPPERWNVSDGACWYGDIAERAKAFEKIQRDLLTLQRYPQKNGGYRAIVEFYKTSENGEKAKVEDQPEKASPFFAFVAVRGPEIVTPTIATYFVKNTFESDAKSLWLWFRSQARPEKLPKEEFPAVELPIVQAAGQWYATDDGFLRYTTAADFGFAMPTKADGLARRTLLETLVETLVRGDLTP